MVTSNIGRQLTKIIKVADKLVADIIKGACELRQAAKEIKQAWKGEEDEGKDKEG